MIYTCQILFSPGSDLRALDAGDRCVVTFDGVDYEFEVLLNGSVYGIGDQELAQYPFFITWEASSANATAYSSLLGAHTIKVAKVKRGQVDWKYLPCVYLGTVKMSIVDALNRICSEAQMALNFTETPPVIINGGTVIGGDTVLGGDTVM